MCYGEFRGSLDRPILTANIAFSSAADAGEIQLGRVSESAFLIDTGADCTCLTQSTADAMGVSLAALPEAPGMTSAGGHAEAYKLDRYLVLIFDERNNDNDELWHIEFLEDVRVMPELNSNLLGRDFINRYDLSMSYVRSEIELIRQDIFEDHVIRL